jgi:hypothetical protein
MSQKKWSSETPYNWLEKNRQRLGMTMLMSAIYDLLFAFLSLLLPARMMQMMDLSAPQEAFFFHFWPLVHLVFPCFCILAWMDTKRNVAIVSGAIIARVIYALFMFLSVLSSNASPAWAVAGGISMIWAIAHYVFLRLSDFGFWEVFSRAGNPPSLKRPK